MFENAGWIIAGVALIVGWAVHAMKISHNYGALNQRVTSLEESAGDHREVRDGMIRMEGRLQAMEDTLRELKDGLVWMTKSAPMYGPPSPPRTRAGNRAAK